MGVNKRSIDRAMRVAGRWSKSHGLNEAEITSFFVWIRQSIEANGLRHRYPVVETYCDWMMHPELNSKKHVHFLRMASVGLRDVKIADNLATDSNDYIRFMVAKSLQLANLRCQLIDLFHKFDNKFQFLNDPELRQAFDFFVVKQLAYNPIDLTRRYIRDDKSLRSDLLAEEIGSDIELYVIAVSVEFRELGCEDTLKMVLVEYVKTEIGGQVWVESPLATMKPDLTEIELLGLSDTPISFDVDLWSK